MKSREQIESIARGKRKMRLTAILLAVLILISAASVILYFTVIKNADNGEDDVAVVPPVVLEGEDIYRNLPIAYPRVDDADINRITINNKNKDGTYTLVRDDAADGNFLFTYVEDGRVKIFYPSICELDDSFSYTDLYAKETSDSYSIPKLTYLTTGLEVAYFGERISLPENEQERSALLAEYGFGTEKETVVAFDYVSEDGTSATRKLRIGSKTVTGTGYYFMVDDREYVYNSLSNYYDYALMGFYSFVNSALISEGLEADSTLEPIYTSDFTQWKTDLYESAGDVVPERSEVVISAELLTPVSVADYMENPEYYKDSVNGYYTEGAEDMTVDLYASTNDRLKAAIVGKAVGKYYDPADLTADKSLGITLTLTSDYSADRRIDLAKLASAKYTYEILEIEAIVGDGEDVSTVGTPVGDSRLVRVAYRYTANGKAGSAIISHAVLDLESAALPESAVSEIRASRVGKFDTPLTFDVIYTKNNAKKTEFKIKITEIIEIFTQKGAYADTVAEDSLVSYRYSVIVNGKLSDEEYIGYIDLSDVTGDEEEAIKQALLGRKVSRYLSIVIDSATEYSEAMLDFSTYEINEIKFFVTKTEIVSFGFLSNSERDPFYGDSIYENRTDGYLLYGLNNSVCEHILGLLGGIGENSSQSVGLSGIETVGAGITPDKLREFGLYEHRIYFELPRNLVAIDSGDEDTIDDYTAYSKLGFTLYVSDILDDGTRYVASDLYDVIVKASNDEFFFLDESFTDFWARENLIMTDVSHMQNIKLELNMEDLVGSYELDLVHREAYLTETGIQIGGKPPSSYYDTFNHITVNVKPIVEGAEEQADFNAALADESNFTKNALVDYILGAADRRYASLTELYESTNPSDRYQAYFPDTLGTTYFKEFIRTMFFVEFEDAMTSEEQKAALDTSSCLMKFSLKIDTDKDGESDDEDYYVYEFYRCGDRRVMVRLYEADDEGRMTSSTAVSDFYISTYGFKRIVYTFVSLLNGEEFDVEGGYPD